MGSLNSRFRNAARDIGYIVPNVDDPFWNFYRNAANSKNPAIRIPVSFYDGDRLVASGYFRCLGAPLSLRNLALDQSVQSLKKRSPALQWSSVTVNNGTPIPAGDVPALLASDPLVRAVKQKQPQLLNALKNFAETLRNIPAGDVNGESLRQRYAQAQTQFVAAITMQDCRVEWSGETLCRRIGKAFGRLDRP